MIIRKSKATWSAGGAFAATNYEHRERREMESCCLGGLNPTILPFRKTVANISRHSFPFFSNNPLRVSSEFRRNCRDRAREDAPLSTTSAYTVLGVDPHCSATELKAAFRAKVRNSFSEMYTRSCLLVDFTSLLFFFFFFFILFYFIFFASWKFSIQR